jgi:hypothetical protein
MARTGHPPLCPESEMKIRNMIAASAMIAAIALRAAAGAAGGGVLDQSIGALFNLRDQLQSVVMKSVKGVADAMQEGPPAEVAGESTIAYFTRRQRHYEELHSHSHSLVQAQQHLLTTNLQLLTKLPKDDPRRQEVEREIQDINEGISENRTSRALYKAKLAEFNKAIEDYHRKQGTPPPQKSRTASDAPSPSPDSPRSQDSSASDVDAAAAAAIGAAIGVGIGAAASRGSPRAERGPRGRRGPDRSSSRCHRNPMTGQVHCGRG